MQHPAQLHPSLHHHAARQFGSAHLHPSMLVYPIFVTRRKDDSKIPGFAPNKQWGLGEDGDYKSLTEHLDPLMKLGLGSVMIFGVVDESEKDERGASADAERNPVILCLAALAKALPTLQLMCDVCLCEYTDHGHCGSMLSENVIDNVDSVERLSEIAVAYAKAGAHWVCPSDMMDGRIGAIRTALDKDADTRHVAILSYTSKKASAMYAPFRAAVESTFSGDRMRYQHPVGTRYHAIQALKRDEQQGASAVMVKPALFYGDLIHQLATTEPFLPVAVYVVSGEYVMLQQYADSTGGDLQPVLRESHLGLVRAGASIIVTYFAPQLLEMGCEKW